MLKFPSQSAIPFTSPVFIKLCDASHLKLDEIAGEKQHVGYLWIRAVGNKTSPKKSLGIFFRGKR